MQVQMVAGKGTNNEEICRFIALLLYMGLVSVPTHAPGIGA